MLAPSPADASFPAARRPGTMGGMKIAWTSRLADLLCASAAYVLARAIWSENTGIWRNLAFEVLTFLALFGLLEALLRGRRLIAQGR